MRRIPAVDRKGRRIGGWAMENAPTVRLTFGKDPNDPNARGKVWLNPDGSVADRRRFGYNNNTDYTPLINLTPEQQLSFAEGMREKMALDFESLKGFPMREDQKNQFKTDLNDKRDLYSRIGNLRFKLQQAEQKGMFTGTIKSDLAKLTGQYNTLAKKTYNPGYGRGMGLMDYTGGYGGVSFNKF